MGIISLHSHQEVRLATSMLEMKLRTQRSEVASLISAGPRIWNSEAAASYKKDARAEITGMVSL